ncbi:DNA polymerase alpha-associated DNA helicase A, putative [Phytophthora infestans T30-4]|uniref:DNA helicase n=1 Tax=Phytophthora infestans (strain T30-4) TaxID=403677 RepID=D0N184_PHYIT|nr:DNA polymerase alpha-associated DNA helicase A, putative [Phytophthora infestans T30-4]EEY67397.1 DNA polymerase alpha-associated DNA helicase A, putative [Phytophthora infestans T30-4]|eukprot:XP_002906045.1 DNA polymerase alpha-associated DNA helicase A, putative [Phytophthora infestans T30-4]
MPKKANASAASAGARALRPVALETWLASTRRLLSMEQQEEVQTMRDELETLDDNENPNVLTHLTLARYSTGLFGRTLLQFSFPSLSLRQAKPHQFTVGDLVQIRAQKNTLTGAKLPTGIVSRVEERGISVAVNSDQEDVDEVELLTATAGVTLDRLVNNATFLKLTSALDQMTKFEFGAAQTVVDVVFSEREPSWNTPLPDITPFNTGLNESQVEAVRFALASKDLALIHGPPGTGKTTTVVEFILQAVTRFDLKVLVCAPSNIAVDNVLDKLASTCSTLRKKLKLTRIGHPARVLPQILNYCLDAKIESAEGTEIVNDIRQEMSSMQKKLQKTRDKSERYRLRREMKANRKEIRTREQKVVGDIIRHSDVVFATNVGAASKLLKDVTFDLVIIDEAAQALEASCWIPMLKAKRCVLAGDHLQLPPTIKSRAAAAKGLEVTLFDRVTSYTNTQSIVKMLDTQYRMHQDISEWSSQAMYKGELKSFEGVARRKLHELPHVSISKEDELLDATLLLLDTAGCELEEDAKDEEKASSTLQLSKSNEGEAHVVARHVSALLKAGLKEEEVAVITPYNKQVQTLKALLLESYPKLEIRSVDGFQGCEKEAVVMSLVRSNASRQVGFLADDRRMNVAITRAKRHVAVVCDTDTISSHKFLSGLVKHFEKYGEYRSAQEYLDEDVVEGAMDEQLVMSITESAAESDQADAVTASSSLKPIAKTKVTKPKQAQKPRKTGSSSAVKVVDRKKTASNDEKPEAAEATAIEPAVAVQEEEEEEEIEDKAVATKSVFQMMVFDSDSSDDDNDEAVDVEVSQQESKASSPDEDLKAASSLLKDLYLSRLARQPAPPAPTSDKRKKKKNKRKKTQVKAVNTAPIDDLKDGEDELEFLTRQANQSSSCAFQSSSRCKKKTTMLGSVCKFCKLKFCHDHALPEVHGCGDAVRKFERAAFQQQMTRSSDTSGKKLTGDKRKLLKKKLEENVSAKTASRSTRAKKK